MAQNGRISPPYDEDEKVGIKLEDNDLKEEVKHILEEKNARDMKIEEIREACKLNDLKRLAELATSEGGFLSDELRREVWPLLLGLGDDYERDDKLWRELPRHKDEDQVALDVNRAFIYYPSNQTDSQITLNKAALSDLIISVLRRHPYLHYFQGYHDIAQVFLLVLSPATRSPAVARLSALRIRDFMLPTLAPALSQLHLIPEIIKKVEPALYTHLSGTQPFFALSGTLTMYAHDIQSYGDIARLFDVFLAREAVFSVYMFARIVLNRKEELFETPDDEPEMLHSILSKLPKPLDLEALIEDTKQLIESHPPETLRAWGGISRHSVLKTARWPVQVYKQTMEDGERYFEKQVQELNREETRKKILKQLWDNRRPALALGGAVLVALLAYQARKSPGVVGMVQAFWNGKSAGGP